MLYLSTRMSYGYCGTISFQEYSTIHNHADTNSNNCYYWGQMGYINWLLQPKLHYPLDGLGPDQDLSLIWTNKLRGKSWNVEGRCPSNGWNEPSFLQKGIGEGVVGGEWQPRACTGIMQRPRMQRSQWANTYCEQRIFFPYSLSRGLIKILVFTDKFHLVS